MKNRREPCPIECNCLCHDTGGGVHDHENKPCPGKVFQKGGRVTEMTLGRLQDRRRDLLEDLAKLDEKIKKAGQL